MTTADTPEEAGTPGGHVAAEAMEEERGPSGLLGQRLEQVREALDVTPDELARASGITAQHLRDVERGRTATREGTVRHIADALAAMGDDLDGAWIAEELFDVAGDGDLSDGPSVAQEKHLRRWTAKAQPDVARVMRQARLGSEATGTGQFSEPSGNREPPMRMHDRRWLDPRTYDTRGAHVLAYVTDATADGADPDLHADAYLQVGDCYRTVTFDLSLSDGSRWWALPMIEELAEVVVAFRDAMRAECQALNERQAAAEPEPDWRDRSPYR